ncbi:TPA: hypothetical protein ACXI12_001406 [Pseudomonas aeruginosa]
MPAQISYVDVGSGDWQWAETYVYAMATYTVACPADRRIQVGMGIMAFGEPRGEKIRFSGEKEITVIGAGALYFRVDDGLGPCKVGFVQGKPTLIGSHWDF